MALFAKQNEQQRASPPLRLTPGGDATAPAQPDEASPFLIEGEVLRVAPGARLPSRCVQCGDSMDLVSIRTLRGNIRYSLCRDHAVSTCGKILAGVALMFIAAVFIGSKLMGDPIGSPGGVKFSILLGIAGMAILYVSLPVRTQRLSEGRHRLHRVHPELLDEARRATH